MPVRKLGIPARDLDDTSLKRELKQMWRTREEAIFHGSSHAVAIHTHRMLELEHEFIARFPVETAPDPSRTRRGSRSRDGQPKGRRT